MYRFIAFLFVMTSMAFGADVFGGVSSSRGGGSSGANPCKNCWDVGIATRLSPSSIAPQFTVRYISFEFYLGASASGTSDTIWARANKYRSNADTFYLAEIDSYSLDLDYWLLEPEIGVRLYFTPSRAVSPYLNLGTFFIIPIISESYKEQFFFYDSTGALYKTMQNSSESSPVFSTQGLYEIGIHGAIGANYRVNQNFAVFGEFAVRTLLGGADIKYDYNRLVQYDVPIQEIHNWVGGGEIMTLSTSGYIGLQFYW